MISQDCESLVTFCKSCDAQNMAATAFRVKQTWLEVQTLLQTVLSDPKTVIRTAEALRLKELIGSAS